MIDLHLHTKFSYDSNESILNYLSKYDVNKFIQTDHAEFRPENRSILFDPKEYQEYIKKYELDVLMGVEIGYHIDCEDEIKEYIRNNNFDLILMSIHTNMQYSYFSKIEKFDFEEYINLLTKLIKSDIKFDVLAHIDCPFRMNKYPLELFYENEQLFRNFFKEFIKTNKYLEFNCSSVYKNQTEAITKYLFNLYYEEGGRNFSLGSDCHDIEDYKLNFDKSEHYLRSFEGHILLNDKF